MKKYKLKISIVLLFSIALTGLRAQETVTATGGEGSGSGGTVSYSVGQVVYTTYTGTDGSAAQGVQHSYDISTITGIEEAKNISLQCQVYPNPVTDYLILRIADHPQEKLEYQLFSIDGLLKEQRKISASEIQIKTQHLIQGAYLLRIIYNSSVIKTFKIIKR